MLKDTSKFLNELYKGKVIFGKEYDHTPKDNLKHIDDSRESCLLPKDILTDIFESVEFKQDVNQTELLVILEAIYDAKNNSDVYGVSVFKYHDMLIYLDDMRKRLHKHLEDGIDSIKDVKAYCSDLNHYGKTKSVDTTFLPIYAKDNPIMLLNMYYAGAFNFKRFTTPIDEIEITLTEDEDTTSYLPHLDFEVTRGNMVNEDLNRVVGAVVKAVMLDSIISNDGFTISERKIIEQQRENFTNLIQGGYRMTTHDTFINLVLAVSRFRLVTS